MAQAICEALISVQLRACWYREEDSEHPVIPKNIRREAYSASFPELCLARWRAFVSRTEPGTLHVLEGVAFQSTVRFMYAADRSVADIEDYVARFVEVVASSCPLLVYLVPPDPAAYLSAFVYPLRGSTWVEKLSAYVARTPIGVRHGWTGVDGLSAFWTRYSELCDHLVATIRVAKVAVPVGAGQHELACTQARQWVLDRVTSSSSTPT